MNERALKILNLLIRRPEYRMTDLENNLHLTQRQINYSIGQVNSALEEKKLPRIKRNKTGDFFIPMEVVQASALHEEPDNEQNAFFSDAERMDFLLLYLMISREILSLNHIIDVIHVSKNTALADIKRANKYAERYMLEITYSRSTGYEINGEELQIRMLLNDLIQKRMKQVKKVDPLRNVLCVRKDEVIHFIRSIEKTMTINYADESFDFMVEVISYTMTRTLSGKVTEKSFFRHQVDSTSECMVVKKLIPQDWKMTEDDLEWLTLLILSSNTYQNRLDGQDSDKPLRKFIHQMVNQFQIQTFIEIEERQNFEKRLFDHLRPAYFRIKYGLKIGNIGLQNVLSDSHHSILIDLMKDLISPLELELGKSFPQDELELLSFYFGHQLSRSDEAPMPKKRAVIVCTNGLIVSKMMMESLKSLFPELHFLSSFSIRGFEEFESDYDMVFTTVLLDTSLPQYIIEPIMSYKEQVSLRYRVLKETGISELDQLIDELMGIIGNNAQIIQAGNLKNDLEHFFVANREEGAHSEFRILPTVDKYLKHAYIQIVNEPLRWEDAIRMAARPLVENKVITDAYVDCLIQQTGDENNYSFLGPQLAIPHAGIEDGVLTDGIGLLISKEPILYPFGQKITVIAPIAISDLTKHLRAMNQLADLGSSTEKMNQLVQLQSADEAYNLMKELS